MLAESTIDDAPDAPHVPTISIIDDSCRQLLTFNVRDGKIEANYDPGDLDQAAQIFVREVVRIAAWL